MGLSLGGAVVGGCHWGLSLGAVIGGCHWGLSLGAVIGGCHWGLSLGTVILPRPLPQCDLPVRDRSLQEGGMGGNEMEK